MGSQMSLRLITAPTLFPVTLALVKTLLRVDGPEDDALLDTYIAAATNHVEVYAGRALMPQTWELVLNGFSDAILLPKGPVSAVSSISYYDRDGILQTIAAANYAVDLASDPQWIVPVKGFTWPLVADGVNNVVIRFVAGYAAVPAAIVAAILLTVRAWYDDQLGNDLPQAAMTLLCNHRSFA